MNGIKMSDCKFYVNKEARTVVCIIPNTRAMVGDYIYDNFAFTDIDLTNFYGELQKKLKMPNSFIGKAVCADMDEWNEELGRKIAYARAKDKCYRSFFKRANKFVQVLDQRLEEIITRFNDMGVKLAERKDAMDAAIEKELQKN